MQENNKKYDIIEADALRPKSSYSGNLYSVEYFQLLNSKLKDGGLAITWGATERIKNSFLSVFPYAYEFGGFMLVGSNKPLELNEEEILKRLDDPFTKNHYGRANIDVRA